MKDQNNNDDLELFIKSHQNFTEYNSGPWVFLACHHVNRIVLQRAQQIFKIEQKEIDGKIFCFSKDKNLNHKEKALLLFFAGIFISHGSVDAAFCLGQLDVLGEQMKLEDLRYQHEEIHELKSEDWQNWHPQSGEIFVSEFAKHYLEQAGVQLNGQDVRAVAWAEQNIKKTQTAVFKKVG